MSSGVAMNACAAKTTEAEAGRIERLSMKSFKIERAIIETVSRAWPSR